MNILLTGAAGLIGMTLRDAIRDNGDHVVPVDITRFGRHDPDLHILGLEDWHALDTLIRDQNIDAIIHCGAISGPMMARGKPLDIVRINVDATALLLDLARVHRMQRFVFCSSISVYGDIGPGIINETTPVMPSSVYGASKAACEQLIQGFAAEYDVDGVSLRIGRVYGPYRRGNCHLRTMIHDYAAGRSSEIPCDPDFIYHYVHVEDVASAILAALNTPHLRHRVFNVGSGEAMTLPSIVCAAKTVMPGLEVSLIPGTDDVPDRQMVFDVSRIAEELGWRPRLSLPNGLAAYRAVIMHNHAAG